MTNEEFQETTDKAAERAIESMKDDLDALAHSQECNGTLKNGKPCKTGSETCKVKGKDGTSFTINLHENPEAWHNEDRARQVIDEAPLSVEVRGGWRSVCGSDDSPMEYRILLGTGGPASQIVGDLDEYRQPSSARFQYQDWFQLWTNARITSEQEDILLQWVSNFYFGD